MTRLVTSLYETKIFLSELRQMVAIRLRKDQRNAERLGEASSRVWGCSLVYAADCYNKLPSSFFSITLLRI
jgi:hypothetical protein